MPKKKKLTANKLLKKTMWNKKLRTMQLGRQTWVSRRPKYSIYPYLLTISFFRRNIFFNLSDFKGHTKFWTNSGRKGFLGRDKVDHLVVISLIDDFVREIWKKGIRAILLQFKHIGKRKYALKKGITQALEKYQIRFVGLFTTVGIAFNGCRQKKRRRK